MATILKQSQRWRKEKQNCEIDSICKRVLCIEMRVLKCCTINAVGIYIDLVDWVIPLVNPITLCHRILQC